jgi:hypothetical protein
MKRDGWVKKTPEERAEDLERAKQMTRNGSPRCRCIIVDPEYSDRCKRDNNETKKRKKESGPIS